MCSFHGVIVDSDWIQIMYSILDHLREHVMKIAKQNRWRRFSDFKKDQEHIAGLQVKLDALVSMFYIYSLFFVISFS